MVYYGACIRRREGVDVYIMKSPSYWKRLIGFTIASALLILPFRFLVVNAVVSPSATTPKALKTESSEMTGGVYDGVLMKMSDLSYANLDPYVQDSLSQLQTLAVQDSGPSGIYKQVANVNTLDWHLPTPEANQFFFSDLANWRIIATKDDNAGNGFYGVAYQKGNTVVIAYRGTDNVQDLVSDVGIYLHIPEFVDQLLPAEAFAESVRNSLPSGNYNVIFTGHSMGAWLAQRMYMNDMNKYTGWNVVGATVFNSIGTNFQQGLQSGTEVKDYHFQGDVFSHYGSSLGQEIEIKNSTPDESIYDKHQMYDFYSYFYPSQDANLYATALQNRRATDGNGQV